MLAAAAAVGRTDERVGSERFLGVSRFCTDGLCAERSEAA